MAMVLQTPVSRAVRQYDAPSTSGRPFTSQFPTAYANARRFPRNQPLGTLRPTRRQSTIHAASEDAPSSPPSTAAAAPPPPPARSKAAKKEEWIQVGVVGPAHGVRGEFKCQPLTDSAEERLGEPGPRWLQAPPPKIGRRKAPPPVPVELEWGRTSVSKGREVWLVKLEGIESPEDAATVRGHLLLIPTSAREPLEDEDEFYVQELIGLRVEMLASGEEVGTVVDMFDGTGTHDVLRIELAQGYRGSTSEESAAEESGDDSGGPRQVLLPFAKELVPVVDMAAGVMRVVPPEGLFELARAAPAKRARRKESAGKREKRRPKKQQGEGEEASVEDGAAGGNDGGGIATASE